VAIGCRKLRSLVGKQERDAVHGDVEIELHF
jgi:hypothetical protein